MKNANFSENFKEKGKKATAVLLACTLVATLSSCNTKKGDTNVTGIELTDKEKFLDELLVLTEGFDINDENAVKKRADDILAIYNADAYKQEREKYGNKFEYTQLDIVNMIYIFAGKNEKFAFPGELNTNDEKNNYLGHLALLLENVLDDGITTYINALEGVTNPPKKQKKVVCAYMFMPEEPNMADTTNAKTIAINLAKSYYTLRENIIKKSKSGRKRAAADYYDQYKLLMNNIGSYSNGEKVLLVKSADVYKLVFERYFKNNEEKLELLGKSNDYANTYIDGLFSTIRNEQNLPMTSGDVCEFKEYTAEYNSADAQVAATHPAIKNDKSKSEPKKVGGGNPVSSNKGKQEQINEPTTKKEKTTWEVTIKENTMEITDPSGETFTVYIPEPGTYEYTIPGGQDVGEFEPIENEESYEDADKDMADELGNTFTLG